MIKHISTKKIAAVFLLVALLCVALFMAHTVRTNNYNDTSFTWSAIIEDCDEQRAAVHYQLIHEATEQHIAQIMQANPDISEEVLRNIIKAPHN